MTETDHLNTNEMTIHEVSDGEAPPLRSLNRDWFGNEVDPPIFFSFALEGAALVFRSSRQAVALCHPEARSGLFVEQLWKYDVAEFFLRDPVTGHYLEFNLSPNGAHWACLFDAPRSPLGELRETGATSCGSSGPEGWQAQADLPLGWLKEHLHFGIATRVNATFILNSPAPQFLTAAWLGGGEPDFHRPDHYLAWSAASAPPRKAVNRGHAPAERSGGHSRTGCG